MNACTIKPSTQTQPVLRHRNRAGNYPANRQAASSPEPRLQNADRVLREYDQSTKNLPGSIQSFIKLIGLQATVRLLEKFGGRPLYIPKKIRPNCCLLEILERDQSQALAHYYGGETVDIPKADTIKRYWRNLSIAAASAAGISRAELVAHYGLSRRQIGNIRRQYRTLIKDLKQQPKINMPYSQAHELTVN